MHQHIDGQKEPAISPGFGPTNDGSSEQCVTAGKLHWARIYAQNIAGIKWVCIGGMVVHISLVYPDSNG
jgi:hypothetical protein